MKKKNQIYVAVIMLTIAINTFACTKKAELPATTQYQQTQISTTAKTNTKNPPGYTGSSTLGDSTKTVK